MIVGFWHILDHGGHSAVALHGHSTASDVPLEPLPTISRDSYRVSCLNGSEISHAGAHRTLNVHIDGLIDEGAALDGMRGRASTTLHEQQDADDSQDHGAISLVILHQLIRLQTLGAAGHGRAGRGHPNSTALSKRLRQLTA